MATTERIESTNHVQQALDQNPWIAHAQGREAAPPIPGLEPAQEVAALARVLFANGYDDMLAGHISFKQPDGTFLVTPYALSWDEVTASDIMHVDLVNGRVLGGKWTVTPAIELHTAAHAAREDVVWAIHNHPRWATVWAGLGRLPGVYEQTASLMGPGIALYDEYQGGAATQLDSQAAVAALADNAAVVLANHGVFIVARGIHQAYLRCVSLETRARLAWHISAIGEGVPMPDAIVSLAGVMMDREGWPGAWEAMVRREIRRDPRFLD